jgi:sporulation protein YlmC with PRC-barrel domain
MIRATELGGRSVVDMDAAEKVGAIEKIILDPEARRVAGFRLTRGASRLGGGGDHVTVPASCVHAIGPDAITIHHAAVPESDLARLETLPRVSDVVGRKVVSEDGRMLGTVDDVLIDQENGRIVGYSLGRHSAIEKLEDFISGQKKAPHAAFLRAEAQLRTGPDLIVAPEDALCEEWQDDMMPSPVDVAASRGHWRDTPPATVHTDPVRADRRGRPL